VDRRALVPALILLASLPAAPAGAQESAHYAMERVTAAAVAGLAASPSFETIVAFGQDGPSGVASLCNDGFVSGFGFWSVLDLPVPIDLRLRRGTTPPRIELFWTGAAEAFEIYSSTAADDVLAPQNLADVVFDCETTDALGGPPGQIIFYNVVSQD
jgi:hypothetical protein